MSYETITLQITLAYVLKNKNIVIIGGTTGIGLSAAKAFVGNGANVIVVGRNAESAGNRRNGVNTLSLLSPGITNCPEARARRSGGLLLRLLLY